MAHMVETIELLLCASPTGPLIRKLYLPNAPERVSIHDDATGLIAVYERVPDLVVIPPGATPTVVYAFDHLR
jgi:hypothetical protein